MAKIGLLFPGQGSQTVGMGKEFYEKYDYVKRLYNEANDILGYDLKKIIFEGSEETLRQTKYTQLAIFLTSIASYKVFSTNYELNTHDCIGAGHSLGEYSALAAGNVFSIKDGISLVKARGQYIQEASDNNPGTMAAIIGLDKDKLGELCRKAPDTETCEMVNFNSPGQIVIAGHKNAVEKAVSSAQAAGAMKAVMLNVSGPFHSSLMNSASDKMKEELGKYELQNPSFSIVTNCDAQITADKSRIAGKLVRQINNPVLWEDSIKNMISLGVETFIEIGPGRILSGLMRRIDKKKKCLNIEDENSLNKTLESLKS
jgi:[acyl-carrier-protein] S-malonyltransferase